MEGKAKTPGRTLQRRFECGRLEEQLWAIAYEEIWPVIRKSIQRPAGFGQQGSEPSDDEAYIARRAERHGQDDPRGCVRASQLGKAG